MWWQIKRFLRLAETVHHACITKAVSLIVGREAKVNVALLKMFTGILI